MIIFRLAIRFCVDIGRFYGQIFRGRNWQVSSKRYILIHSFHLIALACMIEIWKNGILRTAPLMVLFSLVMISGFGIIVEWWKHKVPNETYEQGSIASVDAEADITTDRADIGVIPGPSREAL